LGIKKADEGSSQERKKKRLFTRKKKRLFTTLQKKRLFTTLQKKKLLCRKKELKNMATFREWVSDRVARFFRGK
jgi:hypothetical protein